MSHSVKIKRLIATVASVGTAVQLSTESIKTPTFEMHTTAGNNGNIFIGDKDVSSAYIPRAADTITSFSASTRGDLVHGDYFDLSKVYIDAANAGDSVVIQYYAAEPEA